MMAAANAAELTSSNGLELPPRVIPKSKLDVFTKTFNRLFSTQRRLSVKLEVRLPNGGTTLPYANWHGSPELTTKETPNVHKESWKRSL